VLWDSPGLLSLPPSEPELSRAVAIMVSKISTTVGNFRGDQQLPLWGGAFHMDDMVLLIFFSGAFAVLALGGAATFWFLLR
jgi:hypothetical protein